MSNGDSPKDRRDKMTRTTIKKTGTHEVTLTAIDPMSGEQVTRVFWTPTGGGYVREGAQHTANDRQVCASLSGRGNTLIASSGDDLLRTIRREWASYRKWAVAESSFAGY